MNARMYDKIKAKRQTDGITPRMVIDEIDLLMEELL